MRKDRLYLFTFLSITLIFLLIASVSIGYLVDAAADKLLETQLEFSEREAREAGTLISHQLSEGISKERTIAGVQKSIENSNLESGFVSLFDWSGKIICHPDATQLGQKMSSGESLISSLSDKLTAKDLYQLLQRDQDAKESTAASQVVSLYPVENSDWIVAAHANTQQVSQQIETLRSNFQNILLIMGFVFILTSVVTVRLIGSNYEKKLEVKNQELSNEVINLSKLNSAVSSYQQKVIDQSSNHEEKKEEEKEKESNEPDAEGTTKKRILTYIRNELLTVSTNDIAYIYTENTITYVVCFDGKRSTSNASLDELYSNLDSTYFFRANRQFIIAVSAIDKIVRYGNNQLKILINPNSEVDIIISKNRAAEFKQWLNL